MKRTRLAVLVFALLAGGSFPAIAQISTPEDREASLAKAERFEVLPVGSSSARFAGATDPFYAIEPAAPSFAAGATGGRAVQGAAYEPVSDRVVLRALAERIQPTGVMQFGANTLLLFGERRVKAGDFISVAHNGTDYKVEVVKADTRTFTLRLNNELISKRIQ
jgi:hypothetical protein